MKLPGQLHGAQRRHHRGRGTRATLAAHQGGIVPQDSWCEDMCWDAYDDGSDEQEECLESCWDD